MDGLTPQRPTAANGARLLAVVRGLHMRNGVRTFSASGWGVFVAILMGASGFAVAADLPPSSAPTVDNYCASTGGCFKSLREAEQAMEDAVPVYRGLLRQDKTEAGKYGPDSLRINYRVDNQAPRILYPPAYRIAGWQNSTPMCPGLEATGDPYFPLLCLAEAPAIEQYKATYLVNTAQCTYTNIRVAGDYSPTPVWHVANTPGTSGYVNYVPPNRTLEWDLYCEGWGNVPPDHRSIELAKFQSYVCPEGFQGENSLTPSMDRVCAPNRSIPYITLRKITQTASCAANKNPCHPDNGDKSRVEPDFEFAGRVFNRYYHSLRQVNLPHQFPVGWTFTYSSRLQFPYKYLISDEGYYAKLTQVATDVYSVGKATGTILTRVSDSLYVLRDARGEVRSFDGDGKLVRVQDLNNPSNDVYIAYEPVANIPQLARIASIRDVTGRTVDFEYEDGRLKWIRLPDGNLILYTQDELGSLLAVDYGAGHVKRYHWGESGLTPTLNPYLLTGITSEDGARYASFGYDRWSRVISSELHGNVGKVEGTYLSYQDDQHVSVKTASGEIRQYVFAGDFYRTPLSVTDSGGMDATTYDSQGRLLQRADRRGAITQFGYSGAFLTSTISASGKSEQRTNQSDWDGALSLPLEKRTLDAQGVVASRSRSTYNARGQLSQLIQEDPTTGAERISTTAYCESADVGAGYCPFVGLVSSVDGPRTDASDTTQYQYYPTDAPTCSLTSGNCTHRKGDLWKVINPVGQAVEYLGYDSAGRVTSQKGADGLITSFEYNHRGWMTTARVQGAGGGSDRTTHTEYWPTGLTKRVTQPDGSFVSYRYDAAHRLIEVIDNVGNSIEYVLDNAGNRVAENTHDAAGVLTRTQSRIFNQRGELATQADASANPIDFAYDGNGNKVSVTDALGRVTDYAYDALNRVARSRQDVGGIGAQSQFKYDPLDNLTEVIDPKGLKTTYARNGFGDVLTQVSPDTGTTTFTYDSAGNVLTRTDARGVTANYSYDALGRATAVTFIDPEADIHYVYDQPSSQCAEGERAGVGRLASMIDPSGRTDYCYNLMGDLVRRVQVTDGQALTLRYAYEASGRLQSMTYPDGSLVDYGYDALGQVTSIGVTPAGGVREVLLQGLKTLPFGPVNTWTFGNGRRLDRSYDQDYRPVAISDARDGLNVAFGFDPVGNMASLTDVGQQGQGATLDYDALGRLTAFKDAQTGVAIEQYSYDATGNRLSFANSAGTQSYVYAADSHRLTSVHGATRTYDTAGNTLTIGSEWQYAYDLAGQLSSSTDAASVQATYRHNAARQRVLQQAGAERALHLHGQGGEWLGRYAESGAPAQQVVWLGSRPVGLLQAGRIFYIESDHLGSPRAVIDPQRDVAVWSWSMLAEAFGSAAPSEDPDQNGMAVTFDLRFPGQRYELTSGLSYNYFRDYEAKSGRYSQSDPIGLQGGPSTYAYVGSAPLSFADPLGLEKNKRCVVAAEVVGVVCGTLGGAVLGGNLGAAGGGAACSVTGPGALVCAGAGGLSGAAAGGFVGGIAGQKAGRAAGEAFCPEDGERCDKKLDTALLRRAGIDGHAVKEDWLGTNKGISFYDLCGCDDGRIVVKRMGCRGPVVEETNYRWK
jgi:RHS repeat-associated protein